MKPSFRIALTLALVLGAGSYSAASLAQDAAAAMAAQTAPAPDAALAAAESSRHSPRHKARVRHHARSYDQCLKEKLAVAQHYCDSHADACQAEKDGAPQQCRSEARGEKQAG